jgi:Metallopeptidase family M24
LGFLLTEHFSQCRENMLIIHYTRNDHVLCDRELILIDAGGEYKCVPSILSYHNINSLVSSPMTISQWLCFRYL